MGEEQKKSEEKEEEKAKKDEEIPKAKAADEKPKEEEAKKAEDESKDSSPSIPQEIILRVYMHCEGCARKVRKCLKGFDGVEEVETDCKTHKVVVKGEKADPLKVLERVQRKSHRQVELLSPIPKPPPVEEEPPKKLEEKQVAKPEEKKEEPPQVLTVVLNVHMHCEACAQEIRRRIHRMKGVESVEPDLKSSQVTVKGSFEPPNLIDFIYKRTGKHALIVKVEPKEKKKEEEEKPKEEGKEEKKPEEGDAAEKDAKKSEEEEGKNKQEGGGGGGGGDGGTDGAGDQPAKTTEAKIEEEVEDPKLEMRKNEFYYYNYPQNYQMYPPRFVQQEQLINAYPPQIFSDENPNACSVM